MEEWKEDNDGTHTIAHGIYLHNPPHGHGIRVSLKPECEIRGQGEDSEHDVRTG